MLRIASLSLHPILTTNVHPYGCYVAKFVKNKLKRKGLYYLLTKFEINLKGLQKSQIRNVLGIIKTSTLHQTCM